MDLEKINTVVDKSYRLINNIADGTNEFIKNTNEVIDTIENTLNNAATHSARWVSKKLEWCYIKIDNIVDRFRNWLNQQIKNLNEWYDRVMLKVKKGIIRTANTKLGLQLSDEEITAFAEAIPHPELQIPNFTFDIPELNFKVEDYTPVKIPRIPLIPTPWKEKQENLKENIANIANTVNTMTETAKA